MTTPIPSRDDAVAAWLRAQRDAYPIATIAHNVVDELLDQYRLHADTATPLHLHVCEGGNRDDCAGCHDESKFEARFNAAMDSTRSVVEKVIVHARENCPEGVDADVLAESIADVLSDELHALYAAQDERDRLRAENQALRGLHANAIRTI